MLTKKTLDRIIDWTPSTYLTTQFKKLSEKRPRSLTEKSSFFDPMTDASASCFSNSRWYGTAFLASGCSAAIQQGAVSSIPVLSFPCVADFASVGIDKHIVKPLFERGLAQDSAPLKLLGLAVKIGAIILFEPARLAFKTLEFMASAFLAVLVSVTMGLISGLEYLVLLALGKLFNRSSCGPERSPDENGLPKPFKFAAKDMGVGRQGVVA